MIEHPVEGYFIVTKDNHIFEVKGIVHPKDRIIAYLRYAPSDIGERSSIEGQRYRKIYSLLEREEYLTQNNPKYLWFDQSHDRILQTVPLEEIDIILNPVDALNQLRDLGAHLTPLQILSISIAEELVNRTGIEWKDIGLTGSQLVGLASPESDIDLVVYGSKQGKLLHSTLSRNKNLILGLSRYSGQSLHRHTEFRWGKQKKWIGVLTDIESRKVLQGLFKKRDFFIRVVKLYEKSSFNYGDFTYRNLGEKVVNCVILDDVNSIFTPCEYIVECSDNPNLVKFVSYRGRFTEHVEKGMVVEARGRLESVMNLQSSERHLQLVLGERSSDYLIPVSLP
ncbi:MAG: nucleotidyltransferase domain-containing protein [Candidatus Thorarchaeota archaeon]